MAAPTPEFLEAFYAKLRQRNAVVDGVTTDRLMLAKQTPQQACETLWRATLHIVDFGSIEAGTAASAALIASASIVRKALTPFVPAAPAKGVVLVPLNVFEIDALRLALSVLAIDAAASEHQASADKALEAALERLANGSAA